VSPMLDRVRNVAADILQVPPEHIRPNSGPETLANWDSVQHLNLILALEQEFGLAFEPEEIDRMTSIQQILLVLGKKQNFASNAQATENAPTDDTAAGNGSAASQAESTIIEFAPRTAEREIIDFIRNYWRANHIFTKDLELFRWQHVNAVTGEVNFVLGRDATAGQIDGLLGFMPTAQYDPNLESAKDLWLAVWKVRESRSVPGLGIALLSFIEKKIQPRTIGVFGLSEMVVPIYRNLGFEVGKMRQYYIVNPQFAPQSFQLISDFDGRCANPAARAEQCCSLLPADAEVLRTYESRIQFEAFSPRKSATYFINRYLRHPRYKYDVRLIKTDRERYGLIAMRTAVAYGAKAIRIVDFAGEPELLSQLYQPMGDLLKASGAEYADFLTSGDLGRLLSRSGFLQHSPESGVIVPTYFEPFERRNVFLDYAFKASRDSNYILFKGDCDQDRPNVVVSQ
jgi:acyl carrier protein